MDSSVDLRGQQVLLLPTSLSCETPMKLGNPLIRGPSPSVYLEALCFTIVTIVQFDFFKQEAGLPEKSCKNRTFYAKKSPTANSFYLSAIGLVRYNMYILKEIQKSDFRISKKIFIFLHSFLSIAWKLLLNAKFRQGRIPRIKILICMIVYQEFIYHMLIGSLKSKSSLLNK